MRQFDDMEKIDFAELGIKGVEYISKEMLD